MIKAIAISLTALTALTWLFAAAYRLPWRAGDQDFMWHMENVGQVSIGTYGVSVAWDGPQEYRYLDLFISPLRMRYHVISNEAATLLRDNRAWRGDPKFDPAFRELYEAAKAKDNAKEWRL